MNCHIISIFMMILAAKCRVGCSPGVYLRSHETDGPENCCLGRTWARHRALATFGGLRIARIALMPYWSAYLQIQPISQLHPATVAQARCRWSLFANGGFSVEMSSRSGPRHTGQVPILNVPQQDSLCGMERCWFWKPPASPGESRWESVDVLWDNRTLLA
jgi:hypothetical protein